MKDYIVSERYAKSLIRLAIKNNCLEHVYQDINLLHKICINEKTFDYFLVNPTFKSKFKFQLISKVFFDNFHNLTQKFLQYLFLNKKEPLLCNILVAFKSLYFSYTNTKIVELTIAFEISENHKQHLVEFAKKIANVSNVILKIMIDKSIIGGFILKIDDKLLDKSIVSELKIIKSNLINN